MKASGASLGALVTILCASGCAAVFGVEEGELAAPADAASADAADSGGGGDTGFGEVLVDSSPDDDAADAPLGDAADGGVGECGNGKREGTEACDDGANNGATACDYGQTACAVCDASCAAHAGVTAYCGDARKNGAEKCDTAIASGTDACPTVATCLPADACKTAALVGASCQADCVQSVRPTSGGVTDGCCPVGANHNSDVDCAVMCGNGAVESGESCDTGVASGIGSCPTSCTSTDVCQSAALTGTGCSAACASTPKPASLATKDGCCPSGATSTVDADCCTATAYSCLGAQLYQCNATGNATGAVGAPCAKGSACDATLGSCRALWPFGKDGALLVPAGGKITIPNGAIKDYSDCAIGVGGTLEIAPGPAWTIIGCRGDLVLEGSIVAKNGQDATGVQTRLAPDDDGKPNGELVSYQIVPGKGGVGGAGGYCPGGGGAENAGNGGGGGGGGDVGGRPGEGGFSATATTGGTGGNAQPGSGCIADGNALGGALYGVAGADGAQLNGSLCGGPDPYFYGGGGGGGSRGLNGQGLYVKVWGNVYGAGLIDVSGSAGGKGGKGGAAGTPSSYGGYMPAAGGGGGGGAGGAGGALVLRYGGTLSASARMSNAAGLGGAGGAAGAQSYAYWTPGNAGSKGDDGAVGTLDLKKLP